ncbi:MAG TPA: AlpA family phage regulatory protein [Pirellulales bacterium]|nr:AlpA family phage regulatory protein [Pirellulales bacterium]
MTPTAFTLDTPSAVSPADLVPLLLAVHDVSRLTSLSVRSVWKAVSAGTFPRPVKVGRSTRWKYVDVQRWVEELES